MTRNMELNIIKSKINNEEWKELSIYLKDTFRVAVDNDGTLVKPEFNINTLDLLNSLLRIHSNSDRLDTDIDLTILETVRSLRNLATNTSSQTYIVDHFLDSLKNIFNLYYDKNPSSTTLKIFLQLLINLVINNDKNSQVILENFDIGKCIVNEIFIYESTALLYNIICNLNLNNINIELINKIFSLYTSENEYIHFLLQKYIEYYKFWHVFDSFTIENRILVLEILNNQLMKSQNYQILEETVKILIEKFIKSSDIIFQTVSNTENDLDPYEISILLQILSSVSSKDNKILVSLQNNSDLLMQAAILLINIHRLGNMDENNFSSIQKLNELKEPSENIARHPAFGFKADLVRLIGNLCWKCPKMQNLTREAELIPIILECCNIDARNPFIMQWAIFAIRNICEGNMENQKIIGGMYKQGTVSNNVLDELGITIHSDDKNNEIKVVSYDALRKQ